MVRLLQSIFARSSAKTSKLDEVLLEDAIERVVDGTDNRLRAVIGYRRKLRPAVERAVEYVIDLVDDLPPPIEFSRRRYGADPRLRAFFASGDRLRDVTNRSRAIRGYLARAVPPTTGMIYAGLGVEREERKKLGMDLAGDILRQEVEQVVVNFRNARFVAVSGDESSTRWELKKRGFDNLIETALQALISRRAKGNELAQERQLLRSKLQALAGSHWALESVLERQDTEAIDPTAAERRIDEIDAELARIKADAANLDDRLAFVAATLSAPQEHLRIDSIALTLDRMGVKVADGADSLVDSLRLDEIAISDGRRTIALLVAIPSEEIQSSPRDVFTEASRYL